MLTYPNLIASLATWGSLDALAEATGLPPEMLDAVLTRGVAAPLATRARVARVLGADPTWLFREESGSGVDLTPFLDAREAQGHPRYVTDPATLRAIDGRPAA